METGPYFLRCTLRGHLHDVRAVKSVDMPPGGIVSGSRDQTVRVWKPNTDNSGYTEVNSMTGPTHFIACVCTLPPSVQYPSGLILAGSNDCAIYGFSLESNQPVFKLLGHSGTVCSLASGKFGTIISGSWDKTARVWLDQKCMTVLDGHQEAVWAVEIFCSQSLILTGSADKTIRLWRSGNCERTFSGHEDCVRGLTAVSDEEFLSCSNDCTIRLWQINGSCLHVFLGHTDYIYSIDVLNDNGDFVTCSEDQTVRLWKNEECVQIIKLPSKSLWSVTCLKKNEDIAVGGSDGTIRIFTRHEEFKASPKEIAEMYQELSNTCQTKVPEMIGDLKVNELPGPEILMTPGQKDGQTIMCKDDLNAYVYQWSMKEQQWIKLGDVIDANDSKKQKTMYEGKDYDYVFTIDIDVGKHLKLPYNINEDPWTVAQRFIEKHELNQMFLDQIANFIISNSKKTETGKFTAKCDSFGDSADFCDPFTGQNRYVPSSIKKSSLSDNVAVRNGAIDSNTDKESVEKTKLLPQSTYLRFDATNMEGLEKKLIEFSNKVEPCFQLTKNEIDQLLLLANFPDKVSDEQMASLEKVMSWPPDYVFPGLDLFRLAVRSDVINEKVNEAGSFHIANHLLKFLLPPNPPANKMLVLRTFCNFFGHSAGDSLLKNSMGKIMFDANNCLASANKQIQIAVATLCLNYAVALNKSVVSDGTFIAVNTIEALNFLKDYEAIYRIMVCICTLVINPIAKEAIQSLNIKSTLERLKCIDESKRIKQCAEHLLQIFC